MPYELKLENIGQIYHGLPGSLLEVIQILFSSFCSCIFLKQFLPETANPTCLNAHLEDLYQSEAYNKFHPTEQAQKNKTFTCTKV